MSLLSVFLSASLSLWELNNLFGVFRSVVVAAAKFPWIFNEGMVGLARGGWGNGGSWGIGGSGGGTTSWGIGGRGGGITGIWSRAGNGGNGGGISFPSGFSYYRKVQQEKTERGISMRGILIDYYPVVDFNWLWSAGIWFHLITIPVLPYSQGKFLGTIQTFFKEQNMPDNSGAFPNVCCFVFGLCRCKL